MDTPDRMLPLGPTLSRTEHVFPTLTPAQVSRIIPYGRRRTTRRGEVLVDVADRAVPFFLVISGEIEAVRPNDAGDTVIVRLQPSQFSGEGSIMSARASISRLVVTEPGEVIELTRDELLVLIQTDAELSEILLRHTAVGRVPFAAGWAGPTNAPDRMSVPCQRPELRARLAGVSEHTPRLSLGRMPHAAERHLVGHRGGGLLADGWSGQRADGLAGAAN